MIFEGFKLNATPTISEAYCNNKRCKNRPELHEVSNGFISIALFCPKCHSVYLLKLEKAKRVSKKFRQQCLDELERNLRRKQVTIEFNTEIEKRKSNYKSSIIL